jgi:hypothetical protein
MVTSGEEDTNSLRFCDTYGRRRPPRGHGGKATRGLSWKWVFQQRRVCGSGGIAEV